MNIDFLRYVGLLYPRPSQCVHAGESVPGCVDFGEVGDDVPRIKGGRSIN